MVYPACLVVLLTQFGCGSKLHYIEKKSPETDLCEHAGYERVLVSPLLLLGDPGPLSFLCIEGGWTK